MRIVEINTVSCGSTGTIMRGFSLWAKAKGHEVLVCYPKSRENCKGYQEGDYLIGNRYTRNICRWVSGHFRAEHFIHLLSTYFFINRLKSFNPDVIHIHNVHDSFMNLSMLFNYIRKDSIHVVWTMHDCWLYTGHCTHYVYWGCNKWQTLCSHCDYFDYYPKSTFDDSEYRFHLKRKLLLSIGSQLTLAPVSKWLAEEISKSFLKDENCKVVPNGIDLTVFKPSQDGSVRTKYQLPEGRIYLAAATAWGDQKGLSDCFKLASLLEPDEHLVLVGLPQTIINSLPNGILGMERVESKEDMARLYTVADVVLSLSYAETFGLTIIEANACGTPVIVYDNTAQPELINGSNGFVVPNGSVESVRECLTKIKSFSKGVFYEHCIKQAHKYSNENSYSSYLKLMNSLLQ